MVVRAIRWAGLLAVLLWCAAAGSPAAPQLLGIGLTSTAEQIDRQLAAQPGVAERSSRSGDDGSIERRYLLTDDTFVRVVFPSAAAAARPEALSFALPDTADAAGIARGFETALGAPGWIRRQTGNTVIRRIWGGQGGAEGAIVPARTASLVVEVVVAKPPGRSSVLIAAPAWFAR